MRFKSLIITSLVLLSLGLAEDVQAQRKNKYQTRKSKNKQISHYRGGRISHSRFAPYSFVGGSINAMNYFGDLAPVNRPGSTDVSFTRPGLGLFYGRKFHHSMSYRVAFNYGRLIGDDNTSDPTGGDDPSAASRYERNLSFRNDIKELSATLQIDILPNYGGPQSRMLLNGYFFFGVAVFHHEPRGLVPEYDHQTYGFNPPDGTPKLQNAGEWVKLRELGTEGQNYGVGTKYSPIQFAIPFGIGGEAFINQKFSVGLELGVRKTFTDYIDDVGGTYFDLGAFDDGDDLARIMSDRSVEPIAAVTGEGRDSVIPHIALRNYFENGESYYHNWYNDTGRAVNDKRGTPAKDLYFMTRIRVVYVLSNNTRRAKRR
jgi:hypothetical protein